MTRAAKLPSDALFVSLTTSLKPSRRIFTSAPATGLPAPSRTAPLIVPRLLRRSPPEGSAPRARCAPPLAATTERAASSTGKMRQLNFLIAAKPPGGPGRDFPTPLPELTPSFDCVQGRRPGEGWE